MQCDLIFLSLLTFISVFIMIIDVKILTQLLQEYFQVQFVLDQYLFYVCY
jgi:hypothetical protein